MKRDHSSKESFLGRLGGLGQLQVHAKVRDTGDKCGQDSRKAPVDKPARLTIVPDCQVRKKKQILRR